MRQRTKKTSTAKTGVIDKVRSLFWGMVGGILCVTFPYGCNASKYAAGKCFVRSDLRVYAQILRNWEDGEVNYKYADEEVEQVSERWRKTSDAERGQAFQDIYVSAVPCHEFYAAVDFVRSQNALTDYINLLKTEKHR